MKQLRALIMKEWQYTIKTHRIWALVAVTIFFGFIDPIILKLLPSLLKDQLGGLDISAFMTINETAAVQSFINNQLEITTVVIVLVFAGQLANELRKGWILIPYHAHPVKWIYPLSKFMANALLMLPLVFLSTGIAILYSGILFNGDFFGVTTWLALSFGLWLHVLLGIGVVLLFDAFLLPLGANIGLSLFILLVLGPILGIFNITYPDTELVGQLMGLSTDFSVLLPIYLKQMLMIFSSIIVSSLVFQHFKLRRTW